MNVASEHPLKQTEGQKTDNEQNSTVDETAPTKPEMPMEEALRSGKMLSEEGFSALKQGRLEDAVELFSECLDLMVPHVGQLSAALGPIYLAYGRALMQIAISNMDAMLVNSQKVPGTVGADGKKKAEEEEADDRGKGKIIDLPDIIPEDEEYGEEEEGEDEGPTTETVEDDFQLAWEVLDTARLIYAQQETANPLARLVLADIHQDLGDLQMENEQFPAAIKDFQCALEFLGKAAADSDAVENVRARAAVQFKISLAHEYNGEMEAALGPLSAALELLRSAVSEASDLAVLIQDLELKMAEIRSSMEKAETLKQRVVDDSAATGFKPQPEGEAVNDLSGLVKKRKTPAAADGEQPTKKARDE